MALERGFQEALDKFKARLTKEERDHFQFATLDDLNRTASKIQTEQAERSASMDLPRIRAFLEAFKQFGEVIEVFLNSSPIVAFVWGPMKFLLQVASNFADAFDILLSAYEKIGEVLPLIGEYRDLFNGNSHFDQALTAIYGDVLEFHRRALRVFTTARWIQVFRSMWKDFETRFRYILDSIRSHKELIESHATALHFAQSREDRRATLHRLEQVEAEQILVKHTNLIRWLAENHDPIDHEAACDAREGYPNSGNWLLKRQQYREWRFQDVPAVPLLWLHGIPGAGKTVLASVIIEDCQNDQSAKTAYFYCKDGDTRKTTFIGLVTATLCQLVHRDHELLTWCCDEQSKSGQATLKSTKLGRDILRTVLSVEKTYLVLDGLDECPRSERESILKFVKEAVDLCNGQKPGQLRVIVVSQDENDIRKRLSTASELEIQPADTDMDIRSFVDHGFLQDLRHRFELDDMEHQNITDLICDRSKGMFLFAELVMISLRATISRRDFLIQTSPTEFPKGLHQAYKRITDRIEETSEPQRAFAKRVLGWMCRVRRPLRWQEIQGAYSIDEKALIIDLQELKSRVHIRDICGSLITHLSSDRLALVHSSAKHYLVEIGFVDKQRAEWDLASMCMKYLIFPCFDCDIEETTLVHNVRRGDLAFQEYAAAHWPDHVAFIASGDCASEDPACLETENDLAYALSEFVASYDIRETGNAGNEPSMNTDYQAFIDLPCHDDLQLVMGLIEARRRKGLDGLDDVIPERLSVVLDRNRKVLEGFAKAECPDPRVQEELLKIYGNKWFKCTKAACFYFNEGFTDQKTRDTHLERHERPFRCIIEGCEFSESQGFAKQSQYDKHMRLYHPQSGKYEDTFAKLKMERVKKESRGGHQMGTSSSTGHQSSSSSSLPPPSTSPFKYQCPTCDKAYTRQTSLNNHLRTHSGERPFVCETCNTAFSRKNDLNRHKEIHKGTRRFVCEDRPWHEMVQGQWGCGKAFPRAENLAKHFRSKTGQKCIQPYLEQRRIRGPQDTATAASLLQGLTPQERIIEAMLRDYPELAAQYGGVLEGGGGEDEALSELDNN